LKNVFARDLVIFGIMVAVGSFLKYNNKIFMILAYKIIYKKYFKKYLFENKQNFIFSHPLEEKKVISPL
jgi:hypothetical protein